jgi:acetyltransferase-like isoleucine patch superfamily enzyme
MKYFKDFRGYLFLALRTSRLFFNRGFSSFITKGLWGLKGIKFESGNEFYGIPKVVRTPFSSIKIGKNNRFRSDASSNLIGINHKCILSTHSRGAIIQIGDNCGFSGVSIGASEKIIIGNSVLFGANSVITDFDWHSDRYDSGSRPIIIHDNVWIGLNTVILKGVEIGENSIVGANSLVIKSIPANVIAGGNPCKVLKEI